MFLSLRQRSINRLTPFLGKELRGMMHNWVTAVALDWDGRRRFGGRQGGITCFDGRNWTHYEQGEKGPLNSAVRSIETDSTGVFRFGWPYGVCSQVHGERTTITSWTEP